MKISREYIEIQGRDEWDILQKLWEKYVPNSRSTIKEFEEGGAGFLRIYKGKTDQLLHELSLTTLMHYYTPLEGPFFYIPTLDNWTDSHGLKVLEYCCGEYLKDEYRYKDKPPVELVDPEFILDIANALNYGSSKYGKDAFLQVHTDFAKEKLTVSNIIASAMRHLLAIKMGVDTDPESNVSNYALLGARVMMLSRILRDPDIKQILDDRIYSKENLEKRKKEELLKMTDTTIEDEDYEDR